VKRWYHEDPTSKSIEALASYVHQALVVHVHQLIDNHDFWDDDVASGELTEEDVERIRGFTATIILST